jgi:predicted sulfurtransferase
VSTEPDAAIGLVNYLRTIPGLASLTAKISESDHQPFNRMLVKIKKEIIAFGVPGIDPGRRPAPKVSPRKLKEWLDEGRSITLLDARNAYEVKLGTFRGARTLDLDHFRECPTAVASLPRHLRDELVVTFCTGGIRCEKAAPLLQKAGFAQVFQLDGGILRYFEECGGEHFEGDCFVFDKRVALDASLRETGAALCFVCQTPLTAVEQEDPRYAESISCPHCHDKRGKPLRVISDLCPKPPSAPNEVWPAQSAGSHFFRLRSGEQPHRQFRNNDFPVVRPPTIS